MAKPVEQELEQAFDPIYMGAATNIDEPHLNEHFIRLPGDLAYYNGVYASALELLRKAERELEFGEAEISLEYRRQPSGNFTAKGDPKPVTDSQVEESLRADHRYRKMREEVDNAEVLKSRVAGIVDAIRAKRDMLIAIGANMRAERQGDPTVRERPSLQERERRAGLSED